jgi:hypothetical protein
MSFNVQFDDHELRILRTLIQKAQGHNWPIAWENEEVRAVIEKVMPTTYSTVQEGYNGKGPSYL